MIASIMGPWVTTQGRIAIAIDAIGVATCYTKFAQYYLIRDLVIDRDSDRV